MWYWDCEEGWAPKNWCFWTVLLEKALESLLDCKESQPVHSEGDQPWDFFGRNDANAETPVLWLPHVKSWLIGKDSDAGRNWGQDEKGTTEDEMARWHHWLDGRTWVWVNSGSWWWTGRPGVLRFMGSQTVWHDWATELNWTELVVQLEKEMATHSSTLAWKISWMEEPGRLQSMGSQRVWHNWAISLFGDPVVKTLCSQWREPGFDLWSGNWDPVCHNQKGLAYHK